MPENTAARVFISWSGPRSGQVAKLLHEWLPLVLDSPQLWLSSHDIPDGARWGVELAAILDQANVGIIVVASENISSPWLLFEAGALSKNVGANRVVPFLVDLQPEDLPGPLRQFQALTADKDGMHRLVKLLASLQFGEHPPATISRRFTAFWEEMRGPLSDVIAAPKTEVPPNSVEALNAQIKELAELVRTLVTDRRGGAPAANNLIASSAQPDLLEGTWIGDNGTHLYARVINGKLRTVYCYMGNDAPTGEYYDWRELDTHWFARFRWFREPDINGFAFYRFEGPDKLVGMWWDSSAQLDEQTVPPEDAGIILNFTRSTSSKLPKWVEQHFKELPSTA